VSLLHRREIKDYDRFLSVDSYHFSEYFNNYSYIFESRWCVMLQDNNLEIYRKLTLIRQCQEAIIQEYPTDEIKTPVHLGIGQEAISVGITHNLPPNTKVFGPMRTHGLYLSLTSDDPAYLDAFFAELYGKSTGVSGGRGGSMHLTAPDHGLIATAGIVGATVSLAVGAALANKIKGNDDLVVCAFGDSVIEQGEFWESLNFACVHNLRIIFVCEDNGLAANTGKDVRHGFHSPTMAVEGFMCYHGTGDGTDIVNVIEKMEMSLECVAREPVFLHFTYTRFLEHVGPNTDWHVGYREEPDLEDCDPVKKYRDYLLAQGHHQALLSTIEVSMSQLINKSITKAKAAPFPDPLTLTDGVFAQ